MDAPTAQRPHDVGTEQYDVVVVGAGVVGLAHAAEALDRGLRVLIVERDHRAVGASVRNFGHACVTAQTDRLLDFAMVSRERWLRYADAGGFFAVDSGGVAVARSAEEQAVLEELAAAREPGQVVMLGVDGVRTHLGGTADSSVVGGAFLRDDVRVDPREAVAGLAALLTERGARVLWGTAFLGHEPASATGAGDGVVHTTRGRFRAARTIVCVGHDVDRLYPSIAERHGIRRCGLQMARVAAPEGRRITPAVLSGTSMLRYPAFVAMDANPALRARLGADAPELLDIDANIMLTQRPDGTLIVGDSHRSDRTMDPFLSEQTSDTLLDAIARLLGAHRLQVVERWLGVYASAPEPYLVAHPEAGLTIVSVTSGVGMTISHGLAHAVWRELDGAA